MINTDEYVQWQNEYTHKSHSSLIAVIAGVFFLNMTIQNTLASKLTFALTQVKISPNPGCHEKTLLYF